MDKKIYPEEEFCKSIDCPVMARINKLRLIKNISNNDNQIKKYHEIKIEDERINSCSVCRATAYYEWKKNH